MPYEGREPYIFVSYAHKDSGEVLPLIQHLEENHFRVWYDLGIEAGTEWPAYLESRIKQAAVVLICMSPSAVASRNCRNEINYASSLGKEMLVVYLQDTELADGMSLQLNSTQSLFRVKHPTRQSFLQSLSEARILQSCREGGAILKNKQTELPVQSTKRNAVTFVSTLGVNDPNDLWSPGECTPRINLDQYRLICFRMQLLKPIGFNGVVPIEYRIYDHEGRLLFEDRTEVETKAEYYRFALSWYLRGDDGSTVPVGRYRYVCSINGSEPCDYTFEVVSEKKNAPKETSGGIWKALKFLFS